MYNIICVLLICYIIGVEDFELAFETIEKFEGLEHRLEYVGKFKKIEFYNDSISTIPQATMCAVDAIDNVETLIIGGYDREIDYSKLIAFIEDNDNMKVIFMPTVGHKIHQLLEIPKTERYYVVNDLYEAVEVAYNITSENSACLLSPAAASYNHFKNFEERGNKFKEYIKEIANKNNYI